MGLRASLVSRPLQNPDTHSLSIYLFILLLYLSCKPFIILIKPICEFVVLVAMANHRIGQGAVEMRRQGIAHTQVGVGRVVTSESLGGVMVAHWPGMPEMWVRVLL